MGMNRGRDEEKQSGTIFFVDKGRVSAGPV